MSRIGEKKEKTAENDERRRGNGRKNAARFAVSDVGRKDENRQEKEKTPESVRQIKYPVLPFELRKRKRRRQDSNLHLGPER